MNPSLVLTFLAGVVLVLLGTMLFRLLRGEKSPLTSEVAELRDKVLSLNEKLNLLPEMIQAKMADFIQQRFTNFSDNLAEKNRDLIEKFGSFQNEVTKSLGESSKNLSNEFSQFKDAFHKVVTEDFDRLTAAVDNKLDLINTKVQENLSEGFKKTNETFNNVIERLAKIDEAQKKIETLSTDVVSLQEILSDKKSRGIFGEVQLNHILYAVFGEKNDRVFQTQYRLSTGAIVDAILFTPEPTGPVPVDSKFPMENFKKMVDRSLSPNDQHNFTRLFKSDVKAKIDEIADKYIIPGETSDQAVMFIPAEAVFAEIHAYHPDLIDYAHKRRVWITSPTTFMAVLNTLQIVIRDLERQKFADIIQQELQKLGEDFKRYRERWDRLAVHIDTVHKDVKEIHTTTNKISRKFESIAKVEFDETHLLQEGEEIQELNNE